MISDLAVAADVCHAFFKKHSQPYIALAIVVYICAYDPGASYNTNRTDVASVKVRCRHCVTNRKGNMSRHAFETTTCDNSYVVMSK